MPLEGTYEPSSEKRARDQVEEYEASGGTRGTTLRDMPVVILTTIGAKSGMIRKTPLMRVEHAGRYAVVASLGGAPKHPVWYFNLVADPRVELQDGPRKWDMVAREVIGSERDVWWMRAVAAYPDYADYALATERTIPVVVLEPREHDTPQTDAVPSNEDESPYAGVEAAQRTGQPAPDGEIADFWEVARVHAGLGDIAVVGGVSAAAGVAPAGWAFGDNPVMADELLALVLAETKTATSSALSDYDAEDVSLPEAGDLSIILDGEGHPAALIRTTEVEIVPFEAVTEDFAAAEGEGDRSLESWRDGHTSYFTRILGVPEVPADLQVVTERFVLLYPTTTHRS